MNPSGPTGRLFRRKSIESLQHDGEHDDLKRVLGPVQLVLLGVGGIVGSGVYVMTGAAAAQFAGPAVLLSFGLAGLASILIAFCYAELSSTLPASGAAYSYAYVTVGEALAWAVGWLLLLDFSLAGASLAVGWSAYLVSLGHSFGLMIPAVIAQPTFHASAASGAISGAFSLNLVAVLAYAGVILILAAGVSESTKVNAALVVIKVSILLVFVVVGGGAVRPSNWSPFIPANEGGFSYGWPGVARGASMLFFAYLGFQIVSNAASETRNPQRDLPRGILGSIGICTVIYLLVGAVMTGLVPFRELGVSDALARAADRIGHPQLAVLIKMGALVGISSVLLVNTYGQSRVAFAISKDGLLPAFFSRLHPKHRTPYLGIALLGGLSAAMAATLPLSLLTDMVSLGVALCFSIVAISVMWLRSTRPDLERPFRVPLGGVWVGKVWIGVAPVAAIIMCWAMMIPVVLDLAVKARNGDSFPAVFLSAYFVAGVVIYLGYGRRRSRLGRHATPAEVLHASGGLP